MFRVKERYDSGVWATVTGTRVNDWEWGMQPAVSFLPTYSPERWCLPGNLYIAVSATEYKVVMFTILLKWEGRKSFSFPKFSRSATASGQKVTGTAVSEIPTSLPGQHKFCSSLFPVSLNSENFSAALCMFSLPLNDNRCQLPAHYRAFSWIIRNAVPEGMAFLFPLKTNCTCYLLWGTEM